MSNSGFLEFSYEKRVKTRKSVSISTPMFT